MAVRVLQKEEVLTGTGNTLSPYGVTVLDGSSAAVSGTLGDPAAGTGARGEWKLIVASSVAGGNGTVTVTNYGASGTPSSATLTFDTVNEYAFLVWTGNQWVAVAYSCTIA